MAYWKKIANSNAVPVLKEDLVFDTTPTVNSFNPVTSDGVARAVAGASGEVPVVTENDNGKVLSAIYDEHGPAVEWADAPSGVPEYSAAEAGKVLGVVTTGVEETPELDWVDQPEGAVYTAGDGIAISSGNVVSVDHDSTLKIATGTSTITYTECADMDERGEKARAIKVKLPSDLTKTVTLNLTSSSGGFYIDENSTAYGGKYVSLILSNPSDDSKYVVGSVKSSSTIVGEHFMSYIPTPVTFTGVLGSIFTWGNLSVADLQDANGDTYVYIVACESDCTPISGSYGPQDSFAAGILSLYPNPQNPNASVQITGEVSTGLAVTTPVPVPGSLDTNKVLTVTNSSGAFGWVAAPTELPAQLGTAGQVLSVNSGATGVEWATVQGGGGSSYTAGNGIAISDQNAISVSYDDSISIVGVPMLYDTTEDARETWTGSSTTSRDTAFKIKLGDTSYAGLSKRAQFKFQYNSTIYVFIYADSDLGLDGKYVKMVLANPENHAKYAISVAQTSVAVSGTYQQDRNLYLCSIYTGDVSFTGTLESLFVGSLSVNWNQLKDSNGDTDLYFVLCESDGTVITTGQGGPTNTMYAFTVGTSGRASNKLSMLPSGIEGIGVSKPVPAPKTGVNNSDIGKVLTVTNTAGNYGWAAATTELPAYDTTTDLGKVLTVTANGLEWVTPT